LRESQVTLSYATIRAPISGVIASVTTQEGETVAAGLNAPTFVTIIDLERLQVNAFVDEVDIGKVQIDQRVVFNVDAFPARDFTGRVAAIYPTATIVDNVVKYIVAIAIDDEGRSLLRPEMTASVQIRLESRTVLAIPSRAIRQEGGRSVVHVSNNGVIEMRPIRIGWRDGPWAEVVEGLAQGERILLNASTTTNGEGTR
jgi:macrolide-specific efflux system membrane fusion protein